LVKVNHELTIEAIGKLEQDEIAETRENFEDRDLADSLIRDHEVFCDDLRIAASQLAAVGLVTRFQHQIEQFVKQVGGKPKKTPKASRNRDRCIRLLEELNASLGDGPVPVKFFKDLVTARNSIIHDDSKATWITEVQLREAIEKAVAQVKWYDEKLHERLRAT
jgi:hypothetical protein